MSNSGSVCRHAVSPGFTHGITGIPPRSAGGGTGTSSKRGAAMAADVRTKSPTARPAMRVINEVSIFLGLFLIDTEEETMHCSIRVVKQAKFLDKLITFKL